MFALPITIQACPNPIPKNYLITYYNFIHVTYFAFAD